MSMVVRSRVAAGSPRRRSITVLAVVLLALAGLGPAAAAGGAAAPAGNSERWVAAWAASPVVGTANPFTSCPAGAGLTDATVRNVVFVSAGGSSVRVRLTNAFGLRSMQVGHASVAVQQQGAVPVPGTVRTLSFGGRPEVRLAAGGAAISDPVPLRVAALSTLLVSVYVPGPTGPVTHHPFTAQGNFLGAGDLVQTTAPTGFADTPCWMLVDGVDVRAAGRYAGSVVALGDSITDTSNTTGNANRRWPDDLARRLTARRGGTLSVVNAGLGGNRLLEPRDGEPFWGVPALARLDRDVFAQTAVRTVILLEGVNDIGFGASAAEIIAGYQQVIALTHARGLRILGGTITPFGASFLGTPDRIAVRNAVNAWIRTSRAFDAVVDFAAATAAPGNPEALDPRFDSGDGLHPNDAGCQAMADAVNLTRLFG